MSFSHLKGKTSNVNVKFRNSLNIDNRNQLLQLHLKFTKLFKFFPVFFFQTYFVGQFANFLNFVNFGFLFQLILSDFIVNLKSYFSRRLESKTIQNSSIKSKEKHGIFKTDSYPIITAIEVKISGIINIINFFYFIHEIKSMNDVFIHINISCFYIKAYTLRNFARKRIMG